ncbi:hypothetical protein HG530_003682 [Fusarium avenaceum]|nr:hypothetical protein HG530_003682 [Fusarium avenaceum]
MVQSIRLRNIDTTDNASPIEDWITEPLNKFSELLNFPGTTFDSEVSNWESFIAPLILLQVPNLKYLHVGHKGDCLLFDKFDKPAVVRQQALPLYINSLMVGYDLELDGTLSPFPGPLDISEDGLGGIFPALKRLGYLDICSPNIDTVRHPLQLQNIKRLYCRRFALRKKQLRSLVSSIAALEVFDYYGSGNPWQYYATGQDICEVLAPHKDTLRFMTLVGYYRQAEAFWDPDHEPILDEQALIAGLPPSLQCIAYEIDEKTWEGTIDAIIAYLLSAGKQHTLRCFQILLSGGKYAVVWDETATLRFRDSIRAIVQRVEEMSEQIIDRQRTGTLCEEARQDLLKLLWLIRRRVMRRLLKDDKLTVRDAITDHLRLFNRADHIQPSDKHQSWHFNLSQSTPNVKSRLATRESSIVNLPTQLIFSARTFNLERLRVLFIGSFRSVDADYFRQTFFYIFPVSKVAGPESCLSKRIWLDAMG